jgi:hypothetical protein
VPLLVDSARISSGIVCEVSGTRLSGRGVDDDASGQNISLKALSSIPNHMGHIRRSQIGSSRLAVIGRHVKMD